jgi:hypothetical protein
MNDCLIIGEQVDFQIRLYFIIFVGLLILNILIMNIILSEFKRIKNV